MDWLSIELIVATCKQFAYCDNSADAMLCRQALPIVLCNICCDTLVTTTSKFATSCNQFNTNNPRFTSTCLQRLQVLQVCVCKVCKWCAYVCTLFCSVFCSVYRFCRLAMFAVVYNGCNCLQALQCFAVVCMFCSVCSCCSFCSFTIVCNGLQCL